MKRLITLFLSFVLLLCICACTGGATIDTDNTDNTVDSNLQQIEIVGPWHLDPDRNDLSQFANSLDLFPGYGEWGASMEIRSDGRMSWYIGTEGWSGTYAMDGDLIRSELSSNLEEVTEVWEFLLIIDGETPILSMNYNDLTVYWVYGDQEDPANGGEN